MHGYTQCMRGMVILYKKIHFIYGIDDIAVSAPFEGEGVVYVYRGTPSGLTANNPQVSNTYSTCTQKTTMQNVVQIM